MLSLNISLCWRGLPRWHYDKEPTYQCRRCKRCGFHPWVGASPGGGHGESLQYSCLENPMDRGARWATVHRSAKSQDMTEVTACMHAKCWRNIGKLPICSSFIAFHWNDIKPICNEGIGLLLCWAKSSLKKVLFIIWIESFGIRV